MNENIRLVIKTLPKEAGVYRFYDKEDQLLYVGKAKNLKNRVSSYFNRKKYDNARLETMVGQIEKIVWIVVDSEYDALLLENNIIKEQRPRYNVLLRDGKTYPWICIRNEPFPRIHTTHQRFSDGSQHFGPYISTRLMRSLLDLIRQLYPLRTCTLNLNQHQIDSGKYKVCLEYHIGNCLGPCVSKQSEEEYMKMIHEAKNILKGKTGTLIQELKSQMGTCAEKYEFEAAHEIKTRIEILESYRSKSVIIGEVSTAMDVFSWKEENELVYISYLQVVEGAIVQAHTLELKKKLNETNEDIVGLGVFEMRQLFHSEAKECILEESITLPLPDVKLTVPLRGDKKLLLDLARKNLLFYQKDKWKRLAITDPEKHTQRILETMKKDLRLLELPIHIECFDNANFQGSFPVSAMVLFRNAKPSKREYRHYNIKTVEGPDDFASMREVITRRYQKLLEEDSPLPNLIVVDGGKGQLSAAIQALESLGLRGKIPVMGIAKRLEELYFPDDPLPLYLDKRSETLRVIQQMRDEAHRFGTGHYRKRHQKTLSVTTLEEIQGIGEKTAQKLLSHFKSVRRIKELELEELSAFLGPEKGMKVYSYFRFPPTSP
jgi:excinuclease ABC subunit C